AVPRAGRGGGCRRRGRHGRRHRGEPRAGARPCDRNRLRNGIREGVGGVGGVFGAVPRGLNYVASVETLVTHRSDGVLSVMLNRPEKKNAANGPMWRELTAVFREAALNEDDRVVVVSG